MRESIPLEASSPLPSAAADRLGQRPPSSSSSSATFHHSTLFSLPPPCIPPTAAGGGLANGYNCPLAAAGGGGLLANGCRPVHPAYQRPPPPLVAPLSFSQCWPTTAWPTSRLQGQWVVPVYSNHSGNNHSNYSSNNYSDNNHNNYSDNNYSDNNHSNYNYSDNNHNYSDNNNHNYSDSNHDNYSDDNHNNYSDNNYSDDNHHSNDSDNHHDKFSSISTSASVHDYGQYSKQQLYNHSAKDSQSSVSVTTTAVGSSATPSSGSCHKCLCGRKGSVDTCRGGEVVDKSLMCLLSVEMRRYVEEWKLSRQFHDPFWQRKSHKVVLSVVMVRPPVGYAPTDQFMFFRGINTEVSLPAGSLCAERVAIASAVSSHPSLQRQDFVLLAAVDPQNRQNPIRPCGVCQETINKIQDVSSGFCAVSFTSSSCDEISVDYSVDVSSDGLDSDS
eukprot:GHVS01069230.1.p1 GENE.GHVS01069230.1~~GHVS01069230.1.p1  ORF type:complete len:444 (-),score=145.35 GHVS01069230.1:328-1659(-)